MKSIRTDPRNHAAEGDERIRTAVPAPSTDPAYERIQQFRADIVRALNLTPLVPPQADDATVNIVNDAWSALAGLCLLAQERAC